MSFEIFWKKPNSEHGEGIMLEKYNDKISLVACNISRKMNGTIYKKWGFPQDRDRKPQEVAIPWKIEFGSSRDAISALEYFLNQLTNKGE